MINNLSILAKETNAVTITSDYNTIKERVIVIFKNIFNSNTVEITEDTSLSVLSASQQSKFFDAISNEFEITISDQDELPTTIRDTVQFVIAHQGETIGDRLTRYTWDSAAFESLQNKLDLTLKMLEGYGTSQEGLGTGLLKIFIGTADLFLRIGNTFKTNILKFLKSVKRSEIRYFSESHIFLCKTVENQNMISLMNLEIPVPTGMTASYKSTADYIKKVYDVLNIVSFAKGLESELIDIRRQLTRNEIAYKSGFANTANSSKQQELIVKNLVGQQNKYFVDNNSIEKAPFKSMFASLQEFKNVRTQLINMECYLDTTKELLTLVDNINLLIGDITNYMSEDTEVDKTFIEQLALTIRYVATAFDVYGSFVMRQMALEHNLVLTYETIYATI